MADAYQLWMLWNNESILVVLIVVGLVLPSNKPMKL